MPRYFFHIRDDKDLVEDLEGIECADDADARAEAIQGARDVMAAYIREGRDVSGWTFQIVNENGEPVMTVPFSEAVQQA